MVTVKKKSVLGYEYYYLIYNYREEHQVKTIDKEIGKELPENMEEIKEEFIQTIVDKRWIAEIEEIKNDYNKKLESIPSLLRAEHLKDFGIRFTHNTNKIEGSTLTLRDVELVINEPEVPINKSTDHIVEAKLHMKIYENMVNSIDTTDLSMGVILKWHKSIFNLHPNRTNFAGLIRKGQIYISGSNYVPPPGGFDCEDLLDQLFIWYEENPRKIHPVLLSCLMHLRFVSIHPFDDGNGRMARLLMNFILFQNRYPMFDIPANIRKSYYNSLEKANLKEDEMSFVGWFFKNYLKSIRSLRIPK
ncbi:MAG: Fic family protein [Candidatus Lokiarchaeota archaeon]|nr:Fic family protein [Candidatus Lokiarchaeota archaeon]